MLLLLRGRCLHGQRTHSFAMNRRLFLVLGALISSCKESRYSDLHAKPKFSLIKLNHFSLKHEDEKRVIEIISNASISSDHFYDAADLLLFCYSDGGKTNPEVFSVFFKEQLIYAGDWVDARTETMKGRDVECWKISKRDIDWLNKLFHKLKNESAVKVQK